MLLERRGAAGSNRPWRGGVVNGCPPEALCETETYRAGAQRDRAPSHGGCSVAVSRSGSRLPLRRHVALATVAAPRVMRGRCVAYSYETRGGGRLARCCGTFEGVSVSRESAG